MAEETLQSGYQVTAGAFSGPLDLLVSLIEERKLFVNDISLASVTEDYIAYVRTLGEIPAEKQIADVSYFIWVAATLILIKSKSLLPNLSLTVDEEEKIADLEHRLRLYQSIKNATVDVAKHFGKKIIFRPLERTWEEPLFSPHSAITKDGMFDSITSVLSHVPKAEEALPEVEVKRVVNIDEIITSLTERIQSAVSMSFRDFSRSHNPETAAEEKVHVIVSFLAMLELVREGIIGVSQRDNFEDIEIRKQDQQTL